jgi:hypothetical protein
MKKLEAVDSWRLKIFLLTIDRHLFLLERAISQDVGIDHPLL